MSALPQPGDLAVFRSPERFSCPVSGRRNPAPVQRALRACRTRPIRTATARWQHRTHVPHPIAPCSPLPAPCPLLPAPRRFPSPVSRPPFLTAAHTYDSRPVQRGLRTRSGFFTAAHTYDRPSLPIRPSNFNPRKNPEFHLLSSSRPSRAQAVHPAGCVYDATLPIPPDISAPTRSTACIYVYDSAFALIREMLFSCPGTRRPITRVWPNRDPMGENGGQNLYEMVLNNPVLYADTLGLDWRYDYENPGPRIGPGGKWIDPGTNKPTTPRTFPEHFVTPEMPKTENPAGTPDTVAGGVAGATEIIAKGIAPTIDSEFNRGKEQCEKSVPFDPTTASDGCCCCEVNIHLLIVQVIGRWVTYDYTPGVPSTGIVLKGSCQKQKHADEEYGTITPVYAPEESWWDKFWRNGPPPKKPEQVNRKMYADWSCKK